MVLQGCLSPLAESEVLWLRKERSAMAPQRIKRRGCAIGLMFFTLLREREKGRRNCTRPKREEWPSFLGYRGIQMGVLVKKNKKPKNSVVLGGVGTKDVRL